MSPTSSLLKGDDMAATPPEPAQVLQAIEIYLKRAYGDELPPRVRSQLEILEEWKGRFFRAPVFTADNIDAPRRYTLRLGNRRYPHMKLSLDESPDGGCFLFRVDTHDAHACPPAGSAEHAAFKRMMEENRALLDAIEDDWASAGICTFKTYLRDDLERRRNAATAPTAPPPN
jgi:hypothetical protein